MLAQQVANQLDLLQRIETGLLCIFRALPQLLVNLRTQGVLAASTRAMCLNETDFSQRLDELAGLCGETLQVGRQIRCAHTPRLTQRSQHHQGLERQGIVLPRFFLQHHTHKSQISRLGVDAELDQISRRLRIVGGRAAKAQQTGVDHVHTPARAIHQPQALEGIGQRRIARARLGGQQVG